MAIVVIQAFSGGTLEQYDAVTEQAQSWWQEPCWQLVNSLKDGPILHSRVEF